MKKNSLVFEILELIMNTYHGFGDRTLCIPDIPWWPEGLNFRKWSINGEKRPHCIQRSESSSNEVSENSLHNFVYFETFLRCKQPGR